MAYTPGVKQKPNAKADNPTTAEEACKMMTKMVHKLAHKWTRNHYQDYDDIFAEGMMGVMVAWNKFNDTEFQDKGYRFTTYAWMWVRACMKDYAEKNWTRMNHLVDGDISDSFDRPEYGYELDENRIDVQRRLESLQEEDRQIFLMRQEGYSFDQIAQELNKPSLHKVRNRFLELVEIVS